MKSSGSSGSGTESHGNESHGHESVGSSNGTSKDSALLESSESNKRSVESAKAKTQKEMIKTLKELKLHLPVEKRHKSKSSTLNTIKYALRCVKQVQANEEYYQLLMTNDGQPSGLDVSSYTIEEMDILYAHANKNTPLIDFSVITGRIVYISDQAASILNCKREVFKNSKFVEFLTPQDVSVFHSFTTPYRLPSWSMCTGAGEYLDGSVPMQRFRISKQWPLVRSLNSTSFLFLKAPRIPTDKRIFTTTHTPSCLFQDVDERAVPLLGYLPQDLIGTSILLHLHPNDRPIMLAIHKKILQFAGQPFDHSSVRFCARNGEYIILDTSWSSFVNPWSRKVSFIIGRHKVCM
uniref:Period circadian protein homolog 2 n=1 Tax=Cyclopterus lumpus TaxID=8103 RepID=A0A8C3G2D6_CYCLU